ncbi:MAG TPA: hypothetical protein PLQ65_11450 [Flavihumibacter sp.]|nr:hypothetical protein [Bacteroidota bacterium]HOA37046.1 hypothetical protein [Flavihumibacter sp.]HQD10272.1 hypothetical protein [Flavihumibacter sp.]
MILEIPYTELETIIKTSSKKPIGLKYMGNGQLEVQFMASVSLSVAQVAAHWVLFDYKTSGLVSMMLTGMRKTVQAEVDKIPPLEWREDNKQILVDFRRLPQAKDLLAVLVIKSFRFDDHALVIELTTLDAVA